MQPHGESPSRRARARCLTSFVLAAVSALGCGQILGVDEYKIGEPPTNNTCGALAVPSSSGKCTTVGVARCGDGFQSDGNGGCVANLGTTVCPPGQFATPGSVGCLETVTCVPGGHRDDAIPNSQNKYVHFGAVGGDGSAAHPYGTVEQALQAIQATNPTPLDCDPLNCTSFIPTVIIDDGVYSVDNPLVVDFSVKLEGDCARGTQLVAKDPNQPLIAFGANATASLVQWVKLDGGSVGASIDGADGIDLNSVWIADTNGPAVSANVAKPASDGDPAKTITVKIQATIIDGALGAGILSYGANLSIDSTMARRTVDAGPGKDAGGVCIRPSPWVPTATEEDGSGTAYWDPRRVVRPTLTLTRSVLEDNAGTGLSIVGADASVTNTLVRTTGTAGVPVQRVGIDVAEHPFGDVPATLNLTQSVVEGATVEGIRSRNASVMLVNTDVHDIGAGSSASPGATRCLGSGVRFRWDRPSDAAQKPPLVVQTSTVEHTRDTGILVEGADANIDGSLVSDTAEDPCAAASPSTDSSGLPGLGDGIGIYGHPFAPASLKLTNSRVVGSARAAVAAFGGTAVSSISVDAAVLAGGTGIALDQGSPEATLTHAICGASGNVACVAERGAALVTSLLGTGVCDGQDDTVCWSICVLDGSQPPVPLASVRRWVIDHDEVAPSISDSTGCGSIEGLPRNTQVLVEAAKPVPPLATTFSQDSYGVAYGMGVAFSTTGVSDSNSAPTIPLNVTYGTYAALVPLAQAQTPTYGIDFRDAPSVAVFVCAPHPELVKQGVDVCRGPGRAVAGVQIALDPPAGVGPLYGTGDVVTPGLKGTTADTEGALGLFMGVPPGKYQVHLTSEDATKTLKCTFDLTHGPVQGAQQPGDAADNTFRVVTLPGQSMELIAYCSPPE